MVPSIPQCAGTVAATGAAETTCTFAMGKAAVAKFVRAQGVVGPCASATFNDAHRIGTTAASTSYDQVPWQLFNINTDLSITIRCHSRREIPCWPSQ